MRDQSMPCSWGTRSITPLEEETKALEFVNKAINELHGTLSSYSDDANCHIRNALRELHAARRAMKEKIEQMV